MDEQGEHSSDIWGSVVFVLFFFLLICAFTKSSDISRSKSPQYISATEIKSDLAALNDFHQFSGFYKLTPFIYTTKLKLFISYQDIISENKIINQIFSFLQKTQLLIKPVLLFRLYYRYHIIDSGDLPYLS
jgi:hypothetical protein